jgi:hypothetical protein
MAVFIASISEAYDIAFYIIKKKLSHELYIYATWHHLIKNFKLSYMTE